MWPVLVLGLVQGLTEFLPVSSSGHLILFKTWFGLSSPGVTLEVALHAGTLVAIVWVYRDWLREWVRGLVWGHKAAHRILWQVLLGSVPAGLVGLIGGHWIKDYFSLQAAAIGWSFTAVLLWATPPPTPMDQGLRELTWRQVFGVGVAQALALWPGLSRSGTTIATARLFGVDPSAAAQFSFLLAIPIVSGATLMQLPEVVTSNINLTTMGLATLIAAVSGIVAIQWVTSIVNRPRAWRWFAVYLAVLAAGVWIFGG